MKTRTLSILAGLLFAAAVAGGAEANEYEKEKEKKEKTTETTTESTTETTTEAAAPAMTAEAEAQAHKRLALVNAYIDGAVNHTKALHILSGMELDMKDAAIVNEAQRGLSASIDSALKHLSHVKKMEGVTGVEELESSLKEAKGAARKIKGSKVAELDTMIEPVATHLDAASSRFRDLAKGMKLTLIEDVDLGAAPVRGVEEKKPEEGMPAPAEPTEPAEPPPPPPPEY